MKKILLIGLSLCLLLCGCAPSGGEAGQTQETTASSQQSTGQDQAVRIAYYETLVQDLRQEVLALKAEIYVNRVEYEALIEELTSSPEDLEPSPEQTPPEEDGKPTDTPSPEASFQYRIENGAATVTAYIGDATEVVIPVALGGYPVRAIDDRAFADQRLLVSVEIPEGVKQIGWFAFSGCVLLERVILPTSVAAICYGAFQNCKSTLTVTCAVGSYAEQYAQSYGLGVSRT